MNLPTVEFRGIALQVATPSQAVNDVLLIQEGSTGRAFHFVNAYTMVLARKQPKLHKLLCSDIIFCDGTPLARVLKNQNTNMQSLRGPSIMREVMTSSPATHRHYFLGGSTETLAGLVLKVSRDFPNVLVAGAHSPEYSPVWDDKVDDWVSMIKEAHATVVWVGLGTPKQDYVVHEIASRINVSVVAVGAAFDFIAGTQLEAPKFLQGTGFEWVYRLVKEPRRLWKRYLIGNLLFVIMAIRERFRNPTSSNLTR